MVVRQGDLYWYHFPRPAGSEPGYRRPVVVVQNNAFNQSGIQTAVVCALTTRLGREHYPGNVRLERGEAGLLQASVVNVTQVATVDIGQLTEYIGTLSPTRVRQIIDGVRLVIEPLEG